MDAGHVNENALLVKVSKTTFFARASCFFVHFFPVVARLRQVLRFMEDRNTRQPFYFYLSELRHSPLESNPDEFPNIEQIV